jgi:GAF domain-containing protein
VAVTDRQVGDRVRADITRLSGAGLDPNARRTRVIERLRRAVPLDAVFFASCDPSTLLFTDVGADEVLLPLTPQFLRNEFLSDDVNKFRSVATSPSPVATLDQATGGRRIDSARYREILQPVRLGEEMRVALRSGGVCWGFMCLHREDGTGFSSSEVALVEGLSHPIADGCARPS